MTLVVAALSATRTEVELLYGQCLLRLQTLELRLKAIVATHRFSGSIDTLEEGLARRISETHRKTMGTLVGEVMGSFLVPAGQESLPDADEDSPGYSVDLSLQIVFPAEEFSRIEAEHRDLVALRNSLVHHFLEEHDLRTEDGCLVAKQALTSAIERVSRADKELLSWATDMERTRATFAGALESPSVRDWIVTGRHHWPDTKIVQALLDVATELAPGDWASVETAATVITARHPDAQPKSYGCRTWRQVIHESGRFDLKTTIIDGRRHARYRPRDLKSELS
jgi:hypothetical protein